MPFTDVEISSITIDQGIGSNKDRYRLEYFKKTNQFFLNLNLLEYTLKILYSKEFNYLN